MMTSNRLLAYRPETEAIIKLILERLSVGDPPFCSEIKQNLFKYGEVAIDLNSDLETIEDFIRKEFDIPSNAPRWKDIRKQSVRNYLIYKYSKSPRSLLFVHLGISNKTILNEHINLSQDSFNINDISSS